MHDMIDARSNPFSDRLNRLLREALGDNERVLWQAHPDGLAHMLMFRFMWWIGIPWLVLTLVAMSQQWLGEFSMPVLLFGFMLVAAPFVMYLHDMQALFVITNRRALVVRCAWGRDSVTPTLFRDMDVEIETLDAGRGTAHLNFASGRSTRSPDTDYTGRYGFRSIRNAAQVRAILETARQGKAPPATAKKP